jgi:hypothetical protein
VFGAAVLVALFGRGGNDRSGEGGGKFSATRRQTVAIGNRAVAVVEAGGVLLWRYGDGWARVEQERGNVFYRVERGGAFAVETPAGRVEVHGTSFRVEVSEMKKGIPAAAGALIGAAVVVTVYEGRVLFSNSRGELVLEPGEAAAASPQSPPERRPATLSNAGGEAAAVANADADQAPSDGITREQLLARDQKQRGELARLRQRVRELEGNAGGARLGRRTDGPGPDKDGRPWFDPSPETLKSFVQECRVRFDMPNVMDSQAADIGDEVADEANLTDAERTALNETLSEMQERVRSEIRALYLEATGDSRGADLLSPGAMRNEIADKAAPGEEARVRLRLAQERAGMAQPPANLTGATPFERYYRILASIGDETERRVAAVIGRERAHALREKNGGWGRAMEMAGCAEDREP